MRIWKVLVLVIFYFVLISFMLKIYISQFFSPKVSSIFYLLDTHFFMGIAVHLFADMIYIYSQGCDYA